MVLAIVQARMSSSRLPEKVMKTILGKPVIGYVFERLALSKRIDKIILATSINPENDTLCRFIGSLGFGVFRGSEDNVLERYYLAAKKYGAGTIVRITGDCPLIDAQICDRLIDALAKQGADYAYMAPSFAEGLDCEVFTWGALEKSHQQTQLASEREHVTPYIRNHQDQFKLFCLESREDHSAYRIVVDEPEDFSMLEVLFNDFYHALHPKGGFAEIKAYLDQHPELIRMNQHIIRNEGYIKSCQNDGTI